MADAIAWPARAPAHAASESRDMEKTPYRGFPHHLRAPNAAETGEAAGKAGQKTAKNGHFLGDVN